MLSHGTDILLQTAGLPIMHMNYASAPLIVAIIVYRNVYNVFGGWARGGRAASTACQIQKTTP